MNSEEYIFHGINGFIKSNEKIKILKCDFLCTPKEPRRCRLWTVTYKETVYIIERSCNISTLLNALGTYCPDKPLLNVYTTIRYSLIYSYGIEILPD